MSKTISHLLAARKIELCGLLDKTPRGDASSEYSKRVFNAAHYSENASTVAITICSSGCKVDDRYSAIAHARFGQSASLRPWSTLLRTSACGDYHLCLHMEANQHSHSGSSVALSIVCDECFPDATAAVLEVVL